MDEVVEERNEEGFRDSNNKADDMLEQHDSAMIEAMEEKNQLSAVEEGKTVEFNNSIRDLPEERRKQQAHATAFLKHPTSG
jgi:hypothetical protein